MESEFRYNPANGDWVIISPKRAKRPHGLLAKKVKKACPFCREAIKSQDPPLAIICKDKNKNFSYSWTEAKKKKNRTICPDWQIVAIPNKYPALSPYPIGVQKKHGPYKNFNGIGYHEVIVFKRHSKWLADFSQEEMEEVIQMYKNRFIALEEDKFSHYILLFTNYKRAGGASLAHPHSQIIATPLIDPDLRKSINGSEKYFKAFKKCVHCEMIKYSLKEKSRIIFENKHFIVLAPYASEAAYETRIYPKYHQSFFGDIEENKIPDLAQALRLTLKAIKKALKNPALNFYIHSATVNEPKRKIDHYHWHFIIRPRISAWAGFEFGAGMQVVTKKPEEAAKEIRESLTLD